MKIAVIFEVEANPATEEHCKMIVERFLEGKGVVEKGEDYYGYEQIVVQNPLTTKEDCPLCLTFYDTR